MENKYYAHVFEDKIYGFGMAQIVNEDWLSVEVTKEIYDTAEEKGSNYYIFSEGEIILNPNYEAEEAEKARIKRNQEIDIKIEELNKLCITDLREGNTSNIDVYTSIINSLEESKS